MGNHDSYSDLGAGVKGTAPRRRSSRDRHDSVGRNLSVTIEVLIYPPQADLVQHGLQPTAAGAVLSRRG